MTKDVENANAGAKAKQVDCDMNKKMAETAAAELKTAQEALEKAKVNTLPHFFQTFAKTSDLKHLLYEALEGLPPKFVNFSHKLMMLETIQGSMEQPATSGSLSFQPVRTMKETFSYGRFY